MARPASRHVSVIEADRANWFLLDSLEQVNVTHGLLGKEQIGWLARALDARPDKHPEMEAEHTGLKRTEGLIGLQSHNGRVEFRNLRIKDL